MKNEPGTNFPFKRCSRYGAGDAIYDEEECRIKLAMKLLKAAVLKRYITPFRLTKTVPVTVAATDICLDALTLPRVFAKGVAFTRAKVQSVRPNVACRLMVHRTIDIRIRIRRAEVPMSDLRVA